VKYYVYILRSLSDQSYYIGIKRRFKEHNFSHTITTSKHIPWERVYTEEFDSVAAARKREKYLKSGAGRRFRIKLLSESSSVPARLR